MKAGRPARFDYEYERNGAAQCSLILKAFVLASSKGSVTPLCKCDELVAGPRNRLGEARAMATPSGKRVADKQRCVDRRVVSPHSASLELFALAILRGGKEEFHERFERQGSGRD